MTRSKGSARARDERGIAVAGRLHLVALAEQAVRDGEDEARLVLDEEDAALAGQAVSPERAAGRCRVKALPPRSAGNHAHPASERLDHVAHHAQARGRCPGRRRSSLPAAVERLEEVGEVLAPDARPTVGDRDLDPFLRRPGRADRPSFRSRRGGRRSRSGCAGRAAGPRRPRARAAGPAGSRAPPAPSSRRGGRGSPPARPRRELRRPRAAPRTPCAPTGCRRARAPARPGR